MLARVCWRKWAYNSPSLSSRSYEYLVRTLATRPQSVNYTSSAERPSQRATEPLQTSSKLSDGRAKQLLESPLDLYPRWSSTSPKNVNITHNYLKINPQAGGPRDKSQENPDEYPDGTLQVVGRIHKIRQSGRKLVFLDLEQDAHKLQVNLSYQTIHSGQQDRDLSEENFRERTALLRRGDHVSVRGIPYLARSGQKSIKAIDLPVLTAPCLNFYPVVEDSVVVPPEDSELDRVVEMLTYPAIARTLKVRAKLIECIRGMLSSRDFLEVETPILAGLAGGAAARPFETSATEFPNRKIQLRIAPELWLKRLVIGGLSRVFEIGPSFRNEGLDRTHNPEYTTCEFYAAHFTLEKLMATSRDLIDDIHRNLKTSGLLPAGDPGFVSEPGDWNTIDFIPTLNKCLGVDLPTLNLENQDEVLEVLRWKDIDVPAHPSLPNLLDKLASHFLEPNDGDGPGWIINIPECMSPLSKSFIHPFAPNNQCVSARAELFVQGKELINCYEEENDPFVQRRKFEDQHIYAANVAGSPIDESNVIKAKKMKIDEDYILALEWGLPPTGGWGCGIDRLVMLFADKKRIADVRSFGNLRAVTRNAERWEKKQDE